MKTKQSIYEKTQILLAHAEKAGIERMKNITKENNPWKKFLNENIKQ